MRLTRQKAILAEEINLYHGVFDACSLQGQVKKRDPTLGLATIYRYLKNLESKEEIHSYNCNGRKIYSRQKTNHAHFTCEQCGKKEHMHLPNADFLDVPGKVCHFQVDVVGVCKECLRK